MFVRLSVCIQFSLFVCFCLYTQKKFLRVRLASDDEEEGEVVGGRSQGIGGEEIQDTQQTKEMEEVRVTCTTVSNGEFSFIGLCACSLGVGQCMICGFIHKCFHCCSIILSSPTYAGFW